MFDGSNAHVEFPKSSSRFEFITADIHTDATTFTDFRILPPTHDRGRIWLARVEKMSIRTAGHVFGKIYIFVKYPFL